MSLATRRRNLKHFMFTTTRAPRDMSNPRTFEVVALNFEDAVAAAHAVCAPLGTYAYYAGMSCSMPGVYEHALAAVAR